MRLILSPPAAKTASRCLCVDGMRVYVCTQTCCMYVHDTYACHHTIYLVAGRCMAPESLCVCLQKPGSEGNVDVDEVNLLTTCSTPVDACILL